RRGLSRRRGLVSDVQAVRTRLWVRRRADAGALDRRRSQPPRPWVRRRADGRAPRARPRGGVQDDQPQRRIGQSRSAPLRAVRLRESRRARRRMDDARDLLARRLGARPLHRIQSGGYTLMEHWLIELDGSRAFAKVAVDEPTAGFLRAEERVYSQIEGSFAPAFLGWDDDGVRPILLLEDLSECHWPPPWRDGDVDAVLAALDELH